MNIVLPALFVMAKKWKATEYLGNWMVEQWLVKL